LFFGHFRREIIAEITGLTLGGSKSLFKFSDKVRSCFEFLQKVFLDLMYPFSCVLWAIFWSFSLLFFVR